MVVASLFKKFLVGVILSASEQPTPGERNEEELNMSHHCIEVYSIVHAAAAIDLHMHREAKTWMPKLSIQSSILQNDTRCKIQDGIGKLKYGRLCFGLAARI